MVPPMLPTPGRYPNGHLLAWYVTNRQTPRASSNFASRFLKQPAPKALYGLGAGYATGCGSAA